MRIFNLSDGFFRAGDSVSGTKNMLGFQWCRSFDILKGFPDVRTYLSCRKLVQGSHPLIR